jgi:hypothetical protein
VTLTSTQEFRPRLQSAVAIGERERAAKGDKVGDGKAKPGAAGFAIERSLDAINAALMNPAIAASVDDLIGTHQQ